LRPGTNVAVLTALAHVIVTEGLRRGLHPRALRLGRVRGLSEFVSRSAPFARSDRELTGVPAEELRAAARLYAAAATARSITASA
jgi:formate dehydrogenase major subunit